MPPFYLTTRKKITNKGCHTKNSYGKKIHQFTVRIDLTMAKFELIAK